MYPQGKEFFEASDKNGVTLISADKPKNSLLFEKGAV
jgi:hypothetical protein